MPPLGRPFGYRSGGEYGSREATSLIKFEVEEMGNTHLLEDIAKVLNCEPKLNVISEVIGRRWANPKAIWLCDNKSWCKKQYGRYAESGEVSKVVLPSNALVISDLGPDGKLYVYSGQEEWC